MGSAEDRQWLELSGPEAFRVVVEEDECGAAFAYLVDDRHVVADAWLYNVRPAPEQAPWARADGPLARTLPFPAGEDSPAGG